jgi:UDP-N-acetylmuramoyl-tripeptide--D-alanyl-D-alanine ligase
MGMSGFGEISRLTRVAAPDIAVITNIGVSHIGKLGSRENILKAKLEIIDGMKENGVLILNADNDMLGKYINDAKGKLPIEIVTYGIKNHDGIYADNIVSDAEGSRFTVHYGKEQIEAYMPIAGEHNIYNALAAFSVGLRLKVSPKAIACGLKSYMPSGLRQKIIETNGVTLIEDCYNASPDSMNAGFNVLKTVKKGRSIAVLADMLELGDESEKAHTEVGISAAKSGVDILIGFGDYARYCCEGFNSEKTNGESCFFEDKNALEKALLDLLHVGDTVLFKGSRGMKLEETVCAVIEGWKNK